MSVTKETLERLKKFDTASWAVWSERFPENGCPEDKNETFQFIEENRQKLNPNVVLLSLNPSTGKPSNFSNFHSTAGKHKDSTLKKYIQGNGLEKIHGAYMTDISEKVTPNSSDVKVEDLKWDKFIEQLKILDIEKCNILCFGNRAYNLAKEKASLENKIKRTKDHSLLCEYFEVETEEVKLNFYGIYHYSQRNPKYLPELKKQLEYLNDNF